MSAPISDIERATNTDKGSAMKLKLSPYTSSRPKAKVSPLRADGRRNKLRTNVAEDIKRAYISLLLTNVNIEPIRGRRIMAKTSPSYTDFPPQSLRLLP